MIREREQRKAERCSQEGCEREQAGWLGDFWFWNEQLNGSRDRGEQSGQDGSNNSAYEIEN
jgi:hypothetical protein